MHSDDPDDRDLVSRFWALRDDGTYLHTVKSLLPFKHIVSCQRLTKHINHVSSAWDENQICKECGGAGEVRGRSKVKLTVDSVYITCKSCEEDMAKALKLEREAEDAKLNERLDFRLQRNLAKTTIYSDIPNDIALILIALDRALNPRLLTDSFTARECVNFVPGDPIEFIRKLFKSEVIVDIPSEAHRHAYIFEDDHFSFYMNQTAYRLVRDQSIPNMEEAFNTLLFRGFSNRAELHSLWLDYAVSDCMAYLYGQCQLHNLKILDLDDDSVRSVLRTNLELYSISQMWCVIWKVVRDTAALSMRSYYTKEKAAATIPGKIMRHLEDVKKNGAIIKQWNRPDEQPSGTLGEVFNQYFEVDENTDGIQAMRIFSTPVKCDYFDTDVDIIKERAEKLMRMAIGNGLEAGVILVFSSAIRNGMDPSEALDYTFTSYPQLSN